VLTDENISPRVAHGLTTLGFDVVCVRDRGLTGKPDWELMRWCVPEQRAICTEDLDDFARQHREYQAKGLDHYGILTVGDWTTGDIQTALQRLLEAAVPEALMNRLIPLTRL
jgi:predicted nuclease of predicted toxin-antitoxin system